MKGGTIKISLHVSILIVLFIQACSVRSGEDLLTIGKEGNLESIVIHNRSDEVINFAASELQEYLKRITGKELQILDASESNGKDYSICLSLETSEGIKWDGFRISTSKQNMVVVAKDPRGLLNAVYSLLEDIGCSFVYPGDNEEIVPSMKIIEFSPGDTIRNPIVEHRGLTPYGLHAGSVQTGRIFIDWMAKNKLNFIMVSEDRPSDTRGPAHASVWKEVADELPPELQKRGFVIDMSEHCTHIFFPRSLFNEHPEWFALNNGERKLGELPYSGQMCYSNMDAVEYYATEVSKYAAAHPEMHVIGTWPLDGGNYCECEDCKDPQTIFRAAMHVAEKVGRVRPDIMVEHLSYKPQTWVPPVMDQIPSNMSVLWCRTDHEIDHWLREWIRKSEQSGGVYQFEYFMGDNFNLFANVWLRPGYSANLAIQAEEMGFRGVVSLYLPIENWWRSSFNNWFFAQACWDPGMDIDAHLTKYCQNYYGEWAGEVKELFDLLFTELHAEPYLNPLKAKDSRLDNVRNSSKIILERLDRLERQSEDTDILIRLSHLRAYVEFSLLHCEAFSSLNRRDLDRMVEYSIEHRDQEMVILYPDYVKYRNLNNFEN